VPARKNRPDKSGSHAPRHVVEEIRTVQAAESLASRLLDPSRTRPIVVISTARGCADPYIEPLQVARSLGDVADVAVLTTTDTSWALAQVLPQMTQVYGGAGRVYPPGLAWTGSYWLSPLRFAYSAEEGPRAGDQLIDDAMRMAVRAGVVRTAPAAVCAARGAVSALFPPARAVVTIDDGSIATVWQEWTSPGVPMDRVLALGQRVEGSLDDATGRLDIAASLRRAVDALEGYEPGVVVLVVVTAVTPDVATVRLYPDVSATIVRAQVTSNELDELDDLFSVGEVLAARVARRDGLRFQVRLDDVDQDEAVFPAPALIVGGPPWLSLATESAPCPESAIAEPVLAAVAAPAVDRTLAPGTDAGAKSAVVASLSLSLDEAHASIRELEQRVALATEERDAVSVERIVLGARWRQAEVQVRQLERQIADERTRRRNAAVRGRDTFKSDRAAGQEVDSVTALDRDAFIDPEDQFRYEVHLSWARRITKGDKASRPLAAYEVGERFLDSLRSAGVDRVKVIDVVVEVLTGLAAELDSRELHRLRTDGGGDSPPVVRPDGATCWRVSLQRSTPSARRLHYWRTNRGFELSRVVLHDDFEP